ncbi:MAG: beta-lactamase family protein [Spirulinaceae cyanobacterium SM2_1_0]|nr:beta-lactamase family protein [Spirulinaceae cyanobacterium SM2_1_0]
MPDFSNDCSFSPYKFSSDRPRSPLRLIAVGLCCGVLGGLSACSEAGRSEHSASYHESGIMLSAGDRAQIADRFTDWIEQQRQQHDIPGIAVAVVDDSGPILQAGFGERDRAQQLPVTTDTLFHIGSTHKSLTALLVATLVDEGVVDWDTPVITIDPDFELTDPDSTATVTLRHLLSMSSGIPDEAEADFDLDTATAADVFDYSATIELLAAPGEVFSYSNLATALAGYLTVIAADELTDDLYAGYAELLQRQILTPLGMTRSTILASQAQADDNYAQPYILEAGDLVPAATEDFDGDALAPAGSLKASIADMARYMQMQVNRGVMANGDRLVSAENLLETWQPTWGDYAMGWEQQTYAGVEFIAHEGAYDNFLSVIAIIPDYDLGLVILTNSEDTASELVADAPQVLIELLLE